MTDLPDPPWSDAIDQATHRHGPVLHVITHPAGGCQACGTRGPATVHMHCRVWLACGHTRPLPPLRINLTSQHGKRR